MAELLAQCIEKSSSWLISIQDNSGGWGEYQGAASNALNTAEAILALLDTGKCKAGDRVIQQGVRYLETTQLTGKHPSHSAVDGSWGRTISSDDEPQHLPDTIRSGFALLALNAAGRSCHDPSVSRGLAWLTHTINQDGGWGYAAGHSSGLFPTCVALRAMLRLHDASNTVKAKLDEPIKKGLAHLHSAYRNSSGSVGREPDLVVPHTLYALRALVLARQQGFQVEQRDIDNAITWINQQGSAIPRWFSETIEIGEKKIGAYTFTHVTPALYLDTFGNGLLSKDAIARETLIAMHENMDPISGGMSGKRPVSWATAKALCGLAAVRGVFSVFPERDIPTGQLQSRQYLLILLILLSGSVTVVALSGKLSTEYVGIVTLIILAGLLLYGLISERSFIDAWTLPFRLKKKTASE